MHIFCIEPKPYIADFFSKLVFLRFFRQVFLSSAKLLANPVANGFLPKPVKSLIRQQVRRIEAVPIPQNFPMIWNWLAN